MGKLKLYLIINVTIKNKVVDSATYDLSFDGAPWMQLSQDEITLAPGEASDISIQTSPTEDVSPGKYAATLVATLPEAGIGY